MEAAEHEYDMILPGNIPQYSSEHPWQSLLAALLFNMNMTPFGGAAGMVKMPGLAAPSTIKPLLGQQIRQPTQPGMIPNPYPKTQHPDILSSLRGDTARGSIQAPANAERFMLWEMLADYLKNTSRQ